jgi:cell division protein FtsQ
MKNFLQISLWVGILILVTVLTGFINHSIKEGKCTSIVIDITDQERYGFISEGDITDLLNSDFNTPISQKTRDISTFEIEKRLVSHQAVQKAEVYLSIDGKLNIKIWQRKPILRVFNKKGSFYIDEYGKIMPVTRKFTAHVPVASGHIDIPSREIQQFQLAKSAKTDLDTSLYNDLFELANFIDSNPLWSAQIEQLYVNKDSEFELIPRVGNHTIVIGEVHDLEKKFKKLQLFYRKGLSKTGWNEYKEINLKFKNQVVCTKRY